MFSHPPTHPLSRTLHSLTPRRSRPPARLASLSARSFATAHAMPLRLFLIAALFGTSAQAGNLTVYKYTDAAGVVTYSDRAIPGAAVLRLGDEAEERLEERVRLDISRHAAGETLRVHNALYAPVEIELSLENVDNVTGAPERPIRWILPPRSHIRLLT